MCVFWRGRVVKSSKMRRRASTVDAESYSDLDRAPIAFAHRGTSAGSWSLMNECPVSEYTITSWSIPYCSSTVRSRPASS